MLSVKADNLTKIYKNKYKVTPILLAEEFSIDPGTLVFLTGKSGAGKSTLLRLILREELPDYGKIFFNNLEITSLKDSQLSLIRSKIGVIFQHYRLINYKTVAENISFVLDINKVPRKEQDEIIERLLKLVDLIDKKDYLPQQLSGGEQRRVTIARALATNPTIILADEPTGDLDPNNTEIIIDIFNQLLKQNISIILATHQLDLASDFSSPKLWYLERGHIYKNISLPELKSRYFTDTTEIPKDTLLFLQELPEPIKKKLEVIMPVHLHSLAKLTPKILQKQLGLTQKEIQTMIETLTSYLN